MGYRIVWVTREDIGWCLKSVDTKTYVFLQIYGLARLWVITESTPASGHSNPIRRYGKVCRCLVAIAVAGATRWDGASAGS